MHRKTFVINFTIIFIIVSVLFWLFLHINFYLKLFWFVTIQSPSWFALLAKQSDSVLSEDRKPWHRESKVKWGPCQACKVILERGDTKQANERKSAAVTCPSQSKKEEKMEWPCKEEVGTILPSNLSSHICTVVFMQIQKAVPQPRSLPNQTPAAGNCVKSCIPAVPFIPLLPTTAIPVKKSQ